MIKYDTKAKALTQILLIPISLIAVALFDNYEISFKIKLYIICITLVIFLILIPLYQSLKAKKNLSDIDVMLKYSLQNTL